jgi:RNA polymerase sigma-70 factor (ECF subfamily)
VLAAEAIELDDEPADLDVVRARSGDMRAFERLYRANIGRVYAVCLRMSGDPAQADELVQSAFVRAWQRIGSFRGDSAFSTWLHRLAVNVVLEDRRSNQRAIVRLHDDAEADPRERTPVPAGTRLDLERAVALLPDGARQVLVLHDVEGWPHDEIAAAMGISVGTSKSQLSRARSLLRESLR